MANANHSFEIHNTEITYLKGVGPKRGLALKKNGITSIGQILRYYPRKYLDRTNVKLIKDLKVAEQAVIIGKVISYNIKKTFKRRFFEVTIFDGTGTINCLWFNGLSWISDKFDKGDVLAIFGKVEYNRGYTIFHPEFDKIDGAENIVNTGVIVPVYSSNSELKSVGLDSRGFRKIILNALDKARSEIAEYYPASIIKEENIIKIEEALTQIHNPSDSDSLKKAIYRIKFDEHFFFQLLMAIRKNKIKKLNGISFSRKGEIVKKIYNNLPFKLTDSQIKVLQEIGSDLSSNKSMNRLLQGDVGCGKTIVAVLASAIVLDNKAQVAILAPTEILAEQHYKNFKEIFNKVGIDVGLLIGKMNKNDKSLLISGILNQEVNVIVGTHALLQENVKFKKLGLIIIDEQHRFGVSHRKQIIEKAANPDILSMTATPIPRTLAITIHGDMDISIIDKAPKNKAAIKTRVIYQKDLDDIYNLMLDEINKGGQCFIVYPIIEESEKLDLKAARTAFDFLSQNVFKEINIGYIDGRMKKDERDIEMERFINNKISCLVSTTVIEVGIDIPNATVMLIENANRFGLSQLHQLRGRVGRGNRDSFCFLVDDKENKSKRLKILEESSNGFDISDEDLKLRGPGEFFGKKQHGYIKTGLADFYNDGIIIRNARSQAFKLIERDSSLIDKENRFINIELKQNYKEMLTLINIG
ncbi:MAG: hypothetical protein CBD97_01120 [Pelagibacteraceae bacterium TMED237]|nr:ATP-dependent DNA helicase RecG [Candidatus Neomarinimicrobiota bacterium]OUW96667.1 MAG: hypothetical protein CBD97_01120 [Pelagibacteraceae bacterium TMED237]|tara:strand:- start:3193 stop:5286 length:2094 start_codon:yes stop_codon:yes gene_type:complete